MNSAEIIKSFQHFYENIITKARCSPNWNKESITCAFSWASFCEQMYDKFSSDPETVEVLDNQIHQLTSRHAGVSYCFKDLKHSSAFLCQSFLQNPNVSEEFLQETLLIINPSILNFERTSLETNEVDTLCLELLQSLKFITLPDSDQSLYFEMKAELLLDFLKDAIAHLFSEKQYESQLSFVLNTLSESRENLAIIFHALISDTDSETITEIQDFALNWILLKVMDEKNGSLAHFLWSQPPLKLRKLAVKFSSFSCYYIDYLTQCASSLSLEYENFTKCWKKRASISEITLEYRDILEHFEVLLFVEDELCKTIRSHLSSQLNHEAKTSIWHDISTHVLS